jgi:arylformamidase
MVKSAAPLIDISVPIGDGSIPTWPGVRKPEVHARLRIQRGDAVDDSDLAFNIHTGTHFDAPSHFLKDGHTADQMPLDAFVGECWVAELSQHSKIDRAALEAAKIPAGTTRLLLKTRNSGMWSPTFREDFVGVTLDGAQWLVEHGIRLIGADYLSVQPYGGDNEIHRTLLRKDVVVLEGLHLGTVAEGRYELIALPMKIVGLEAAPVRAVLRKIP